MLTPLPAHPRARFPPPPFSACCPPGSALRASLIDRGKHHEVPFTFPSAARVRVYVGPASRRCAMPLSLHLNHFIVFLPRPSSSPSIASCSFPCGCPCPTVLINLTRLLFDCDAFSDPHECLRYSSSVCSCGGSLCCRQSRKTRMRRSHLASTYLKHCEWRQRQRDSVRGVEPIANEVLRGEQLRGAGLNTCVCRIDERRCCCSPLWAPSRSSIPLSAHLGEDLSGFPASLCTPRDASPCAARKASASDPFSALLTGDSGPVSAPCSAGRSSLALQAGPSAPSPGPSGGPGVKASSALSAGFTGPPAGPGWKDGPRR